MTALHNPLLAQRPLRDGLRQKHFPLSRQRAAGQAPCAGDTAGGAAPDCVFKRFPAIGDTAANPKQRW